MHTSLRPGFPLVGLIIFVLCSCNLPISAPPLPTISLPSETPIIIPPQVTPTIIRVVPTPTFPPPSTSLPTAEPTLVPTVPPAPTAAPPEGINGSYSVILVAPEDVLNIRQTNSPSSPILGTLQYNSTHVYGTGNQTISSGSRWLEIFFGNNSEGWVNATFLTEMVAHEVFCGDPRINSLIDQFKESIGDRDGERLASLISPSHGLNITYLREGTVANYNQEQASWLFDSTYEMNWGAHPGSGLDVVATFSSEVLPNLQDALLADYTTSCNSILVGGTTYEAAWPKEYENINFLSLHRPGSPGDDLNWRTWLVGFEYVGGEPYLFAMNHLFWEP